MSTPHAFPTLCPLPWLQLSANTDTSLRVCCNTDHGAFILNEEDQRVYLEDVDSIQELFNSPFLKEFRRKMLAGESLEYCRGCYQVEKEGGTSIRQNYLGQFARYLPEILSATEPDGTIPTKIRYVDFSFGNSCNLKCRMCNPTASYSLKSDFDSLGLPYSRDHTHRGHTGWQMNEKFRGLLREILPTIEEVLTTGGEPFLTAPHVELLEILVAARRSRHVVLRYHTNLTTLPPRLVALWRNFKRIEVHASIEAMGPLNDYIRYGSRWERVVENFEKLIALKDELPLWLEVHACFQAYNLFAIPGLLKFLLPYREKIPPVPHFIWLSNPSYLSTIAVPPLLRAQAKQSILEYLEQNRDQYIAGPFRSFNEDKIRLLRGYLNQLTQADDAPALAKAFQEFTQKLDLHRGQRLEDLVPELRIF